jgi:hypothetical protein
MQGKMYMFGLLQNQVIQRVNKVIPNRWAELS